MQGRSPLPLLAHLAISLAALMDAWLLLAQTQPKGLPFVAYIVLLVGIVYFVWRLFHRVRSLPCAPRIDSRYHSSALLVTQPGKCRWDRELATRQPLPSRLEVYGLPLLYTPDELWKFLGLESYSQLVHLADLQDEQASNECPKARNYWERRIPKRSGGERLLQAPKPRLKAAQRKILREILDKVPIHSAATAYRRGCDVKANATAHASRQVVLCYDLLDFFPSIKRRRVAAFFQWLGYHPKVARILSFLCTVMQMDGRRGLPQGAPTSPALANAICYRLDCRLAGLAKRFGAAYTRYADDIAFSGDDEFKRGLRRFVPLAERILGDEGFQLHRGKRRFMRRGQRQRVTGLLVNHQPSLGRAEIDRIKALLHKAAVTGDLNGQNRDNHPDFAAHLLGKIAWIARFHPARAAKLRAQLDALAPHESRQKQDE